VLRFHSVKVGKNPDFAQVRNPVPLGTLLELLTGRDVSGNDEAGFRAKM